jgi:hypothetical protein
MELTPVVARSHTSLCTDATILCGWLREGGVSGEFVEHDEEKVAAGLIGGVDGLWLQFLVFGDSYRLDENVETYVTTLLDGLRPGRSQ